MPTKNSFLEYDSRELKIPSQACRISSALEAKVGVIITKRALDTAFRINDISNTARLIAFILL